MSDSDSDSSFGLSSGSTTLRNSRPSLSTQATTNDSYSIFPPRERREKIDVPFVLFLINYAVNDPECSPLFKAYLEEVVLNPSEGENILHKIDYHLRNPDIRRFRLGPNFLRQLEEYSIYDQVFPVGDAAIERPFAPIPPRYWPGKLKRVPSFVAETLPAVAEVHLDGGAEDDEFGEDETEAEGEEEEEEEEEEVVVVVVAEEQIQEEREDGQADEDRERVAPPGRRPTRASLASTRSRRSTSMTRVPHSTGKYAQLLHRLLSIPRLPAASSWDPASINRAGPDWVIDSWYKGKRQPPLAARLETIVNFLSDEDVDRAMFWETQFAAVVSFLEWLAHEDDKHQLGKADPQTRAMFNDAVTKAKAHVLFEKHHSEPTPLEITRPSEIPLRSTRLNWMINTGDWPLPGRNPAPDRRHLLPRPITPRPVSLANEIAIHDDPSTSRIYDTFVEHESAWWQRVADPDNSDIPADADSDEERANLAYIESAAFNEFSRPDTVGFVRRDPGTGLFLLPDNTLSIPADPVSWARERGARRAGLQQMLRASHPYLLTPPGSSSSSSSSSFSSQPAPYHRPVVFPVPASLLREVHLRTALPQWTPPRIPASQLPPAAELDPFHALVTYRALAARLRRLRELARLRAEERHGADRRWATLPRNAAAGAPFVWRMVDPDVQAAQDAARRCWAAVEALRAGLRRAPRPLLARVLDLAERGIAGLAGDADAEGVELAPSELEYVGERREGGEQRGGGVAMRLVDEEELRWLRLLGSGECVNRGNWRGRFVPDEPREQYKLFLIFARRVQRLLDDPNPDGLFARHDAKVTVEELLKVMNAGADSRPVTKFEFEPHDACCWLDRMHESGHVRFYLDPACYGVVQRPHVEFYPEHRVIWPGPQDTRDRPGFLGYVADWGSVIEGGAVPDVGEGSEIWNFFMALALRLGYTIRRLSRELGRRGRQPRATPAQHLRESFQKWEQTCARLEGADTSTPSPAALRELRARIIAEVSANEPMLAPAREHRYISDDGGAQRTALVRDHNWDWASPRVTGRQRQFWTVNRWPVGTGHLPDATERAIRLWDAHADPAQTYDPALLDPTTDPRYLRPKLRPYGGEHGYEKVVFRPGPAIYPVGDTRLQREAVEGYMLDMVHKAVGLDRDKGTWAETLAKLNPFTRPSSRMDDKAEDGRLPPVDLSAIPKSWDPQAERDRVENDGEDDDDDEMEADDYSGEPEAGQVGSVDVVMSGMGP